MLVGKSIEPRDNSAERSGQALPDEWSAAWSVLQVVGLVLLVVGATDILLAWAPLQFGNPEWEFGTVSSTLNSLPVPAMGLALIAAAGIARVSRPMLAIAASWSVFVALAIVLMTVLYLLDVPLALKSVQEPANRSALLVAIAKAALSIVAYFTLHVLVALSTIRTLRKRA